MKPVITKRHYDELIDKAHFVDRLNEAFADPDTRKYSTVSEIRYEFFGTEYGIHEYAVVYYYGGGMAVVNCVANSLSAIFRAIGRLLDGGYYDEVAGFKRLKEMEVGFDVEG